MKLNFGMTDSDRRLFAKYMNNEKFTKEIDGREVTAVVSRVVLMRSPMSAHLVHWACLENIQQHFKIIDGLAYHIAEL